MDARKTIAAALLLCVLQACGPETAGYPPPQGVDAGTGGAAGGPTGTGTTSAATSTEAPMPAPCMDTGGTTITQQCCASVGDWPATCQQPPCGSGVTCDGGAPTTTLLCDCQLGRCYDTVLGCVDAP